MASTSKPIRDPNHGLDQLPLELIETIMTKLDVASIQSLASTCRASRSCAVHVLSFLPNFHLHEISPSMDIIQPLLRPDNPHLRSVKLDCARVNDSFLDILLRPSLQELYLRNCIYFSWALVSQIGQNCKDLRFLYLSFVAKMRGRIVEVAQLEKLLTGCSQLETLILMFDKNSFMPRDFARLWALASSKLTSLEIGHVSSAMVTRMLSPAAGPHQSTSPSVLPNIQKLCLSVDCITDTMVSAISNHLVSLTHLDLQDSPRMEPEFDLSNSGLQQINASGRLKHLSLVRRSQVHFRRVNDFGILLLADKCSTMESICLGGFCEVTDTGYKAILHSCSRLHKLCVYHGTRLTNTVFHDVPATSLSLTHVILRCCNLLTSSGVARLTSNRGLCTLDLRDCSNVGDEALRAISTLPMLKTLVMDGCDVSDIGLSYVGKGLMNTLVSLSVRGCEKLTDSCISSLFGNNSRPQLRELDLSNLPNLSDAGILSLAKTRVPISELRMRQCPFIGDTSVMALASMQFDGNAWLGSSLTLLDLYDCGGITRLSFKWLERPYFPRLRWLGLAGSLNRAMVDVLARNRQHLHVCALGEELGTDRWVDLDDTYVLDYDEWDEYEIQHIQEAEAFEDALDEDEIWHLAQAEDVEFEPDENFD